MNKHVHSRQELENIWNKVPPDYYQNGVKKNIIQRLWHMGKLRSISELIASLPHAPETILDLGCASGWFLSEISKIFPHTKGSGIDVYKDAIDYGKKHYAYLDLYHGDGHALPFPKHSFDIVICNEVLEHVVDPRKVLQEIKRVLKPNGHAIIEMDTGNFLFRFIWYWWTHVGHGVWEDAHIQVFNTEKLQNLIKNTGFFIKRKKIFNASMAVVFLCEINQNKY